MHDVEFVEVVGDFAFEQVKNLLNTILFDNVPLHAQRNRLALGIEAF